MSHISGVKRALTHTNSFTGERLPKFGVETMKEEELGSVSKIIENTGKSLLILNYFNGTKATKIDIVSAIV